MKIERELSAKIIDIFENFLDEKGIVIENNDDDMDITCKANIYGEDYYSLEDEINDYIINFCDSHIIHKGEMFKSIYEKTINKISETLKNKKIHIDSEELIGIFPNAELISTPIEEYIKYTECLEEHLEYTGEGFEENKEYYFNNIPSENVMNERLSLYEKNIEFTFENNDLKEKTIEYIENVITESIAAKGEGYNVSEKCLFNTLRKAIYGEVKNL